MTSRDDRENQTLLAAFLILLKGASTNVLTYALLAVASFAGWNMHASFNSSTANMSLSSRLDRIENQTLLLNVKMDAMLDGMPPAQQKRTQDYITQRLQVLALAGKPTKPE